MPLTPIVSLRPRIARLHPWLLAACLFVFVLGGNWAATDRFGSDMPDWDQYDAEVVNLYAPWFTHDHFLAHLFKPHNEHRVVLTKLQNLAVLYLGGQWDVRVQCLFNSLLHGFIAVGMWFVGRRGIRSAWWQAAFYLLVAALYALPFAWQNLLGGFHSQQYWLIGLSLVAMLLLPFWPAGSGPWLAGLAAAILALFSMGSGFLAAVVVVVILAWQLRQRNVTWRGTWVTLTAMTILIVIGATTIVKVPYHEAMKAKTVHDYVFSMLRSLEWPLYDRDWGGLILWAPWALVAGGMTWRLIRGPETTRPATRAELSVLALGGWVLIQVVATAYARGAGAGFPASRYMDTLMISTIANAVALIWLAGGAADRVRSGRPALFSRFAAAALALAWTATLIVGIRTQLDRIVNHELPDTRRYYDQAEAHLRSYVATQDPAELTHPIPYPNAPELQQRISYDFIRQRLTQSVRAPLKLEPATGQATPFLPNWTTQRRVAEAPRQGLSPATPALAARPTWGSFAANGAETVGTWRSAPLTAPLHGWLRFETAGNVGEPGVALELHDAATDTLLASVVPTKEPHDTWRSAYVRAPARPFVVVARDEDPRRWIAFSAPVELSSLSYWAWQLEKNGLLIARLAGLAAVGLLVMALLFARGTREPQE